MLSLLRSFSLIAMLLACAHARAICTPVAHYIYVGSGPQCSTTSIQTAIDNVVCPGTQVVVSTALGETYINQHIQLNNSSIAIVGSTAPCKSPPVVCAPGLCSGGAPAKVAISGDGANPVFYVNGGAYVTFANLSISGGKGAANSLSGGGGIGVVGSATALTLRNVALHDNTGSSGGGIAFYGDGSLTVDGASIYSNSASYGAGISAYSSYIGHIDVSIPGNPDLPTSIYNNVATVTGGGIYVAGNTDLRATSANLGITGNSATQSGGGIAVGGGATANLGLVGNAVSGNTTDGVGGAIVASAGTSGNGIVRLFNLDGSIPLNVLYNVAGQSGGGVYVYTGNATAHATLCLFDVDFSANRASYEGSAIRVGNYGRLLVNPVSDSECDPQGVAALGAKANLYAGSHFYANAGTNSVHQTTDAAVIDIGANAQVAARRVHLVQNNGGYAVRAQDAAGSTIAFSECLMESNLTLHELVALAGAPARFDGCTIAGNTIQGPLVFAFDSGLTLTRSIIDQGSNLMPWNPNAAGLTAQYLLLTSAKLPSDQTVVYADPQFVDADSGDFHLQPTSKAVDFAPYGNESGATDLAGGPREVDKAKANLFGPRDLGAFEVTPACFTSDTISCDGFEAPL